jgi:uncharacterized membrane protein
MQFGYVNLWLWERFGGWGLATVGILGAINIPDYIVLGEFGIAILLAILATRLPRGNWTTALLSGVASGVGIFACYATAYGIADGLIPR